MVGRMGVIWPFNYWQNIQIFIKLVVPAVPYLIGHYMIPVILKVIIFLILNLKFIGYMGLPTDYSNEYTASNLLHLLPNLPNE